MTTRTSPALKQAFKRFVELVKPIEDVRYVVAFDDGGPDIFTYIVKPVDNAYTRVHAAEFQIMREFPDLDVLFHVRTLDGRQVNTLASSSLAFSKDADY